MKLITAEIQTVLIYDWLFLDLLLFSIFKLTTSSGKHLEDISHSHVVSLMFKLISSAKHTNDLSIGFDHNSKRRRDELTSIKNIKGKFHLRIMPTDVFGFVEHQEKAVHGLGYQVTQTRNKDDAVIDKAAVIAETRYKIAHIHWYLPH